MQNLKKYLLPLFYAAIAFLTGYGGAEVNRAMPLNESVVKEKEGITADGYEVVDAIEISPDAMQSIMADTPQPGRVFHATLQVIWSRKTPGIPGEDQMISTETVKLTTVPNIGGFMAVLSKNIAGGRKTPCAPCDIVGPYGELTWYSTGKPIPEGGQKPTPETKDPPITK